MCETIDYFIAKGEAKGIADGIRIFIEDKLEDNISDSKIIEKLQSKYNLTEEEAKKEIDKCRSAMNL